MLVLMIVRYTPMAFVRFFAPIWAFFASFLLKKTFRHLDQNIQNIYHLPCDRGFGLLFKRQMMVHQVLCFFETIKIIYKPDLLKLEGISLLQELFKTAESSYPKGAILTTAHLGSWELIGMLAIQLTKRPFYVLAKEPAYRFQKSFLDAFRSLMPVKVLWSNRPSFLKQMIKALEEPIWMAFVMDQKPEKKTGPQVSFFDQKTIFNAGPGVLSVRDERPVVSVFCVRKGPFHYELLSKIVCESWHNQKDETALTQKLAAEIERVIRLYPEQWCWNYKRWRF